MAPQQFDDGKLLTFIEEFIVAHGYAPSIRELTHLMGVVSTQTVWKGMHRLRLTGAIEWTPNTARTIRVL